MKYTSDSNCNNDCNFLQPQLISITSFSLNKCDNCINVTFDDLLFYFKYASVMFI